MSLVEIFSIIIIHFIADFIMQGYIDGDGFISKQGRISVDGHINIEPLFINIINKLKELDSTFNLSLTRYQQMIRINFNTDCSAYLNSFRKQKKLPILKRKWERN